MTVIYEAPHAFYFGSAAHIVDTSKEMAWAEKFVHENAAYKWILGRFVEANNANSNRQYFSLEGLRLAQPTIAHAPMNINHAPRKVVGAFVATEMMIPVAEEAAGAPVQNPFIEALGVMWKHYFPEEYALIQMASDTGNLFYSMECVPAGIKCDGPAGCGQEFSYEGRFSTNYCAHLNSPHGQTIKHLVDPHFTGGALIVPPEKPGWKNATVNQLSLLVEENAKEAEKAYEGLKEEFPQLTASAWESLMLELVSMAAAMDHKFRPDKDGVCTVCKKRKDAHNAAVKY